MYAHTVVEQNCTGQVTAEGYSGGAEAVRGFPRTVLVLESGVLTLDIRVVLGST
jgi:hypothetical protein